MADKKKASFIDNEGMKLALKLSTLMRNVPVELLIYDHADGDKSKIEVHGQVKTKFVADVMNVVLNQFDEYSFIKKKKEIKE